MGKHGALGREAVVGTLVGEVRFGPYLSDYFDCFPEQFAVFFVLPGVGVGMELRPFVGPDSASEPDLQPSPGHVVQQGQVLRQPYGVPPGSDVCHLPDTDRGSSGCQVSAQQYRVWQVAHAVGAEVMLTQPDCLEPHFLGQDGLLPEIVQHIGGVGGLA